MQFPESGPLNQQNPAAAGSLEHDRDSKATACPCSGAASRAAAAVSSGWGPCSVPALPSDGLQARPLLHAQGTLGAIAS